MTTPPRRVVVVSPRTAAVRRPLDRQTALDHQDVVGDLFVRSLMRSQLGLSLRLAGVYVLLLGGLPLIFAFVPAARSRELLGLPLPWLVLGVLVPPLLLGGALLYVRLAERTEREFIELVENS